MIFQDLLNHPVLVLIRRLWTRLHLVHTWGRWQNAEGTYERGWSSKQFAQLVQIRDCTTCGKRKVRSL